MLKNYFLTTIRTLRQNAFYTALSVFGIALTFVFVCILFLIIRNVNGNFIPPKYTERTWLLEYISPAAGSLRNIRRVECEAWKSKMKTPEIILVTTLPIMEEVVMSDRTEKFHVLGVSENYFDVCHFRFLRGRPFSGQEIADNIPVAIIDRHTANLYFGRNENPIGKNLELYSTQYRVVGVVENNTIFSLSSRLTFANVWIPEGTAKTKWDHVSYMISFTGKNKESISEMQEEFTRVLGEINTAEDAQYSIPSQERKSLKQKDLFSNEIGFTAILLIMILIPALNILSLNISKSFDRSEEIAIRKAFGAPIRTIFAQLLLENTMITFMGAVIGICVTPLLLYALDQKIFSLNAFPMALSLNFDWVTVFLVIVPCVLLFSFLSGSIPAWIIAKREISNVLKGEIQ